MDVRCEKCLTQYEFDDAKVTEAGVTVKCTSCGHVFKVRRMVSPLPPASRVDAFAPEDAQIDRPREWKIRQVQGNVFTCRELTTLQKWIVERKVVREDEISLSGDSWKRLGNIPELAGFFLVVDQANRAQLLEQQLRAAPPERPRSEGVAPGRGPSPTQEPTWLESPTREPPPRALPAQARPPAQGWDTGYAMGPDLDLGGDPHEDDLRAIRGRGGGKWLGLLAVLAAAGGGAYVYLHVLGHAVPGLSATSAAPGPASPTPVAQAPRAPPTPAPVPVPDAGAADAGPIDAGAVDAGLVDAGAVAVDVDAGKSPSAVPVAAKPKSVAQWIAEGARAERTDHAARALEAYAAALALDPGSAEAWSGKGQALIDLQNYSAAEASFSRALKVAPRFSEAEFGLAEAYKYQGKRAAAVNQYKKYIDDHPHDENAAIAKRVLADLSD